MSRAKVTINSEQLVKQLIKQGFLIEDSPERQDIVLDACADCVVFEKEQRTLDDVRRDFYTAWNESKSTQWPDEFWALIVETVDLRFNELKKVFSSEQGHSDDMRCLSGMGLLQCVLFKNHTDQHMNGLHRW